MRATTLFAGLAAVAAVSASDVVDLTKSAFDDFVGDSPLALVEFFAPWVSPRSPLLRVRMRLPSSSRWRGRSGRDVSIQTRHHHSGEHGDKHHM